jgi:D-alanyl-D-alanine carboxypeptidase (penicillin-binding protein 5/6)
MRSRIFTIVFSLLALTATLNADAANAIIPAPPELAAEGYLLIDADSGLVLVEHNSLQRLPPASLTKMMTSYVVSSVLMNGTLKLEDEVNVSVKAWRTKGSSMFIREGTKVSVEELLRGVIIQSGNDASIALAEHIAGSEEAFASVMNKQADLLGMVDTKFINATGLPDEDHYTTASDLAKLTVALIYDFPEHYKLYKEKYFTYGAPGEVPKRQNNRNLLLWRDKSVDGVKTGHTEAAGYCLVASAERNGMRLISVVMGARSEEKRATESLKLLTYGFRYFETLKLYDAGDTLKTVRVWGGTNPGLSLGLVKDMAITVPRGSKDKLEASMDIQGVIEAPVSKGQQLGKLVITDGESIVEEVPLVALTAIDEAGFFKSLWDAIMLFFTQVFNGDPLEV